MDSEVFIHDLRESLSGRACCGSIPPGVSLSSGSLCGMHNLPDDPAARGALIERWAAEQEATRARASFSFKSRQLAIRVELSLIHI